jgi:esterase/lipase superfamily enzyme
MDRKCGRQALAWLSLVAVLTVTACGPSAELVPDDFDAGIGRNVPVFVGTTRQRSDDGLWSSSQPGTLNYAVIDVNVPPAREPGLVQLSRGEPDPRTDFLTAGINAYADRAAFRAAARELLGGGRGREEVVVTIHGFNNTMGDSVFRTAQMAVDYGMDGPVFHYAWPSRGVPLGYAADRDAALLARAGLEQMLDDLHEAGAKDIMLVAHSMGTQLTMEVLRQMALRDNAATLSAIGGVTLISPDIDPALFRAQARDIGRLPDPFVIFVSRRDPALRLSARLTGHENRLGNITSLDEVAGLDVTVIDLSGASDAASQHLAAATSPTMIAFLRQTEALRRGMESSESGQVGLLPGAVLVAEEATAIMIAPVTALGGELQ